MIHNSNSTAAHIVFCGYREEDIQRSLSVLERLRSKFKETKIILLNTGHPNNLGIFKSAFDASETVSNDSMEFGGYQGGLDLFRQLDSNWQAGALFLNDTIWKKNLPDAFLERLVARTSCVGDGEKLLIGKCDSFGVNLLAGGLQFRHWVSTHLFYLSSAMLESIAFRVSYDLLENGEKSPECQIAVPLEEMFFQDVAPPLDQYLKGWLFAGGWHNSALLTNQNYTFFRRKLRSIMNEYYLSALANLHGRIECLSTSGFE
jgi:hypothetical protein